MPVPLGDTNLIAASRLNSLAAEGRFGRRLTIVDRGNELAAPRRLRRFIEGLVLNEGVRLLVADEQVLSTLEGKLPGVSVTDLPPLFVERLETFEPQTAPAVSTLIVVRSDAQGASVIDGIPGVPLTTVVVSHPELDRSHDEHDPYDATYDLKQFERLR